RRARPGRGAERRDRGRGLPLAHAREPRGAARGERMPMSPVLEVSDGGVVLGGRPVLRGIELSVDAGEVVAVLGANGSGKSTLVRTVLGLTPLRRGEVRLFGTPLAQFRDWRRIGYVPQRVTATSG